MISSNKKFPRVLRLFSLLLVYTLFMGLALILGAIVFTSISLVVRDKDRKTEIFVSLIQNIWSHFVNLLIFLKLYEEITVKGVENVYSSSKNTLIIANHPSLIDVVVIGANIKNFNCVVKSSIYNHPFLGMVVRTCNFIPNSGGEEFIARCKEGFKHNRPLIIFPQGTRTISNKNIKFKRGAANIVARIEDVAIIPTYIETNPPFFSKEKPWYHIPKVLPKMRVTFGKQLIIPQEILKEPIATQRVKLINKFLEEHYNSIYTRS